MWNSDHAHRMDRNAREAMGIVSRALNAEETLLKAFEKKKKKKEEEEVTHARRKSVQICTSRTLAKPFDLNHRDNFL